MQKDTSEFNYKGVVTNKRTSPHRLLPVQPIVRIGGLRQRHIPR